MSDLISDMRAVSEDHQSAAIEAAERAALLAAVLVVALSVIAGTLSFRLLGRVASTFRSMLGDEETAGVAGGDEAARMASALDRFRQSEAESRKLLEEQAGQAAEERRRFAAAQELQSELSRVVSAARAGDFSARIRGRYEDASLAEQAIAVNDLIASMDHGISETIRAVDCLATGDLTKPMSGNFEGSFARLSAGFNSTISRLGELVREIQTCAGRMRVESQDIAGDIGKLSRRTEQQAASLEETSATMEEMAGTISHSAQNADHAQQISAEAARRAAAGVRS